MPLGHAVQRSRGADMRRPFAVVAVPAVLLACSSSKPGSALPKQDAADSPAAQTCDAGDPTCVTPEGGPDADAPEARDEAEDASDGDDRDGAADGADAADSTDAADASDAVEDASDGDDREEASDSADATDASDAPDGSDSGDAPDVFDAADALDDTTDSADGAGTSDATSCGPTGRYTILDPGSGAALCGGDGDYDGSGLVKDNTTGLTWMGHKYYPGIATGQTWADAAAYCAGKGMRLPTLGEALGIAAGNFDLCAWPCYWNTSTSTTAGSGRYWHVYFEGTTDSDDVGYYNFALCVR